MKPYALFASSLLLGALALPILAQQSTEPQPRPQRRSTPPPSAEPAAVPATTTEPEAAPRTRQSEPERQQPTHPTESERTEQQGGQGGATNTTFHFDMKEISPSVTHHEVTVNGHTLRYTASAGRMPIKNGEGVTEALMFYVAYTVEGSEAARRPLTFSYNGGPGAAVLRLPT